jgi:hypothetical protein
MIRQPNEPVTPLDQMEHLAMAVVETFCSIVCMPVEIILRPQYGTRYFPVYVTWFSAMMMIFITAFSSFTTSVVAMIPFTRVAIVAGYVSLWSFTEVFFLLLFVHGIRLWRRMAYMDMERFSRFEGPALPIFRLLPGGGSFNFVRIFLEPVTVWVLASVLERLYIIQPGLATYLHFAAFMLAMKCFVLWYRAWEFARNLMDMQNAGPLLARVAENKATQDDLAAMHLASLPKILSPEIRQETVSYIARLWRNGQIR